MDKSIHIRPAAANDATALSALALRSKAHWGYSDVFLQSCAQALLIKPEDISHHQRRVYRVAEVPNALAGFYALEQNVGNPLQYELEKLFVEPVFIGRGMGKTLFQHATQTIIDAGGNELFIESDPYAAAFYKSQGAVHIGERASEWIPGRSLPLLLLKLV